MSKSIVGKVLKNKLGNTCEVLYEKGRYKSGHKKYIINCEVCSEDKELWPDESIHAKKYEVLKGHVRCGCRGFVRWSKEQYKILIKRKCDEIGFKFKGFLEKEGKCSFETYISLYNPETGNTWNTTTIGAFLSVRGGDNDPHYRRIKQKITNANKFLDSYEIPDNKTVIFKGDQASGTGTWEFECENCSKDLVTLTLGDDYRKFSIHPETIKNSSYLCRCVANYRWSSEEREVIVKNILKEENHQWIGWENSYKDNHSKFKWKCKNNHNCATSVRDFLKTGRRCNSCADYGFSDEKEGIFYLVKWVVGENTFLKYGISNRDVNKRKTRQSACIKDLPYSSEDVLIFKSVLGSEVRSIEKEVKKILGGRYVPKSIFPEGYTETLPYSQDIIEKIKGIILKKLTNENNLVKWNYEVRGE